MTQILSIGPVPPLKGESQPSLGPAQDTAVYQSSRHRDGADTVHISEAGRQKSLEMGSTSKSKAHTGELGQEEQQTVDRLKKRDMEVRAHEAAHMAAGSGLASGATYQYTMGPDGKRYVTGGEVQIDTSEENDPRSTIAKMQQVRRAALAPAQPSGADRGVAAQATKTEQKARLELSQMEEEAGDQTPHPSAGTLFPSIDESPNQKTSRPSAPPASFSLYA